MEKNDFKKKGLIVEQAGDHGGDRSRQGRERCVIFAKKKVENWEYDSKSRSWPIFLKIRLRVERQLFTSLRMGKGEFTGVEFELSGTGACSVKGIADNRDAESFFMKGMEAQLVGAAGDGHEVDPGKPILKADFFPMRDAHFAVHFIVNLDWAVFNIEPEWQLDGAAVFFQNAIEQGDVAFAGLAFVKLAREMAVRLGGAGDDDEAGGVHIEPVHRWLFNAAWKHLFHPVGDAVDFLRPSSRNGEHTAHFIDDDKGGVGVENFEEWSGCHG